MILTITMNPSVDINYKLDTLVIDDVNRVSSVSKTAGGKGLNVARVLSLLNEPVSTTGLLGGTIGDYIIKQLDEQKIKADFMMIEEESRNCIAVIHDNGKQTEILESGPTITSEQGRLFLDHVASILEEVSLVTISGSLPKGLPDDFYVDIIDLCSKRDIKVILDTSGTRLKDVLNSHAKPFAIKPNRDELNDLFSDGRSLSEDALSEALQSDLFEGIQCVMVSDGSRGAFVKWGGDNYKVSIPKVSAVNPVGSGDATVAGLAEALKKNKPVEAAIKTAMTTGILNALNEKTGVIEMAQYDNIYKEISVSKIN